jgi:hypothetical protein
MSHRTQQLCKFEVNCSSVLADNGRKRTWYGCHGKHIWGVAMATIPGVHHHWLFVTIDIKYEQNPSSTFRDMSPDGRTDGRTDGQTDGRTVGVS